MEDLGTWPAEQATVLLEVLQKAGLTPDARPTRNGVVVTVPDGESDEAHRQLVANMDSIARAARGSSGQRGRGSPRRRPAATADEGDRTLTSERLLALARPLGLLLIGLLLISTVGRASPLLTIAVVVGLVYVVGRRAQRRGDDGGPHLR